VYRSLDATVADTLAYWRTLPAERRAKPRAGLSPQREADVLKQWQVRERRGRKQ
jgi:2'-hydroxyisoflavone reductase